MIETKYEDIQLEKPFHIWQRFSNGNLKDWTEFKKTDNGILIYFRDLKSWVNPPTTQMENGILKKIEHYGVSYISPEETV